MSETSNPSRLKKFWRERVVAMIICQLKQGITPEKMALTFACGICLAAFPILGTTTLLCFTFGIWLKLNQPVIQLINWLGAPLQLIMIPVFVRIGELAVRAPRASFSIPELFRKFHESPVRFFQEFGLTGVHGIIGWLATAPFAGALLYLIFLPVMKKLAATLKKQS